MLGGTYRVVRRIGSGGMGEVYEATHARLAHRYAVKFLRPGVRDDAEALPRFMREAQVTSRLRHPGIVSVVDFNTLPNGTAYLVMEYLEGEPLGKLLARAGPLPLARVVAITDQLSSALGAAHREGVVHRDMHPQNVFVVQGSAGESERVKILDFGISKISSHSQKITGTATVLGTPQYMSPEQAEGKTDQLDAASDQFSLAAMVYEMLTGRPAFGGETLASIAYQIVHAPITSLRTFRPEIPDELDQVVSRALAKDKNDRFPSVAEFALHLRWTAALATSEAKPNPPSPTGVPMPRAAELAEPTVVSTLPSGMAEVLRQTGQSRLGQARAASTLIGRPEAGAAWENQPTVVRASSFAGIERTVAGITNVLAKRASAMKVARFVAVVAAGFAVVAVTAKLAWHGGTRAPAPAPSLAPAPATSKASPAPPPPPPAPAPTAGVREAAAPPSPPAAPPPQPPAAEELAPRKSPARSRPRPVGATKQAVSAAAGAPPAASGSQDCRITVGSYPWSDLWVDGTNTGLQTPVVGLPLACGPHRLEFKRRDLKVDQVENVTLGEGRELRRQYDLKAADLDE
jgi:serine/threonine-protein kinase